MPTILLTGATGYIASHTWLELLAAGFDVVGVDDFYNSSPEVLNRLEQLSGQAPDFVRASVCDAQAMDALFAGRRIDAVVHFAAFKAVGESTQKPLRYYANNIGGLLTLATAMRAHGVDRIVFSSSATVYGEPERLPIREDAPTRATNPYGETKLIGETILRDMAAAEPGWQVATLRYFNPVGAHESGRLGEDPRGVPNNLMPYVAQVAVGRRADVLGCKVFSDHPLNGLLRIRTGHRTVPSSVGISKRPAKGVLDARATFTQVGALVAVSRRREFFVRMFGRSQAAARFPNGSSARL